MKWFFNKSLRFQIMSILLIILIIPSGALVYNVLISARTERIIEQEQIESLNSFALYVDKAFDENLIKDINTPSTPIDPSYLDKRLVLITEPLAGILNGIRVGFYIPSTKDSYIYGVLKQYNNVATPNNNGYFGRFNQIDSLLKTDLNLVTESKKNKIQNVVLNNTKIIRVLHPIIRNNKVIAVAWGETIIHPDIASNRSSKDIVFIITLISLLLGLVIVIFILKKMAGNVNSILKGLKYMEGDLSYQIEPIGGEIGQVAESINKMARSLSQKEKLEEQLARSEKLAALGHLISGVAHEIRNPLAIISATVQVMEREYGSDEELNEYIKVVKEQSNRESKVIQELLDYAKPSKTMFIQANINKIMENILTFTKHYIRDKKIELELVLDESIPEMVIDVDKIKQVLMNVIINGCEAMGDGGILTVKTEFDGKWIKLIFKDNGIGMDEITLKSIFNPYYTTKPNGTGLGLAISNSIIEMHGGFIQVESLKKVGSTFIIYLPRKLEGKNLAIKGVGENGKDISD